MIDKKTEEEIKQRIQDINDNLKGLCRMLNKLPCHYKLDLQDTRITSSGSIEHNVCLQLEVSQSFYKHF